MIQATEKLNIQSARQRARALPYRDGLSYADILDRGIGPSRFGHRVRCSPSLSFPAPASAGSELICPKRTSVYSHSAITTLTISNRFASIASTVRLMEGSLLEDFPPLRSEASKRPHPHSSPSFIPNIVTDLGLLLLVPGSRPHLLRLSPGPEHSHAPLLPLFLFPLRLLFHSSLDP